MIFLAHRRAPELLPEIVAAWETRLRGKPSVWSRPLARWIVRNRDLSRTRDDSTPCRAVGERPYTFSRCAQQVVHCRWRFDVDVVVARAKKNDRSQTWLLPYFFRAAIITLCGVTNYSDSHGLGVVIFSGDHPIVARKICIVKKQN